jgi:arsenate reductase
VAKPTVLHNPNCGTSRTVLESLREAGIEAEVVQYLKTPLDEAALRTLLGQLADPPADLVRKDKRFGELGLDADDYTTVDAVVALLVEHPELMQRPVVRSGRKAVIARPATRALEFLGS